MSEKNAPILAKNSADQHQALKDLLKLSDEHPEEFDRLILYYAGIVATPLVYMAKELSSGKWIEGTYAEVLGKHYLITRWHESRFKKGGLMIAVRTEVDLATIKFKDKE